LITVRSCVPCNEGFKKDEEYFAVTIVNEAANFSDEANRVAGQLFKVVAPPRERVGVARRIQRELHNADVFTHGGLYVGTATVHEPDLRRINRVLCKIIRGLFVHEFKKRAPGAGKVAAELKPGPQVTQHPWFQRLLQEPTRTRGGTVFQYKCLAPVADTDRTIWVLAFYDCILAAGWTGLNYGVT
jgi:hypothetical protein